MQLLRTILIIIIIYYLARLFARYVLPLVARYFIRRTAKKFSQRKQPEQSRKTGEIHVESKPNKKPVSENLGEYIDYEEVKD